MAPPPSACRFAAVADEPQMVLLGQGLYPLREGGDGICIDDVAGEWRHLVVAETAGPKINHRMPWIARRDDRSAINIQIRSNPSAQNILQRKRGVITGVPKRQHACAGSMALRAIGIE